MNPRKEPRFIKSKTPLANIRTYRMYVQSMSEDSPSYKILNGENLTVGIIAARFNESYVDALIESASATLTAHNTLTPAIYRVPGSNELPYAAERLASSSDRYDALIALGVVLAGATHHHLTIADSTATALHQIAIKHRIPVINGIIVVESEAQAEERCSGSLNRGREFALAALEMALFQTNL